MKRVSKSWRYKITIENLLMENFVAKVEIVENLETKVDHHITAFRRKEGKHLNEKTFLLRFPCEPIKKFSFYNIFICFTLNDGYEWWMFNNINYKVGIWLDSDLFRLQRVEWSKREFELFRASLSHNNQIKKWYSKTDVVSVAVAAADERINSMHVHQM